MAAATQRSEVGRIVVPRIAVDVMALEWLVLSAPLTIFRQSAANGTGTLAFSARRGMGVPSTLRRLEDQWAATAAAVCLDRFPFTAVRALVVWTLRLFTSGHPRGSICIDISHARFARLSSPPWERWILWCSIVPGRRPQTSHGSPSHSRCSCFISAGFFSRGIGFGSGGTTDPRRTE